MTIAEHILRDLAEPVLVLDQSLQAVIANPAFYETLQIVPGELEGKTFEQLVGAAHGQNHLKALLDAIVPIDDGPITAEIECVIPPRTRKILSVTARRVSANEMSAEMILVELRDVTRARKIEQKVQELNHAIQRHGVDLEGVNRELDSFSYSVSHNLRTPLRLTNKVAHLLLQEHGEELPAGAIEKIRMILESTREMGKLIEDLLNFSRTCHEPIRKRRVNLIRLAKEALSETRDDRLGRNVGVTVGDLPPCMADRALMKQVLLNLIENAQKFTRPREKASIEIGSTRFGAENIYFVRDNGVGFDMRHAESMFEAFHQLHKEHHFEGSGVGLALSKRIVERHGGRIWAEGETGRGATIFFTLSA